MVKDYLVVVLLAKPFQTVITARKHRCKAETALPSHSLFTISP